MEDKDKKIPTELLEKVTGGLTDGSLEQIPEKKKKKLDDLYGDGDGDSNGDGDCVVRVEVVMAMVMVVTMTVTVTVTRNAAHLRPVRLTEGRRGPGSHRCLVSTGCFLF
jgi:hypothetical protein